MSRELRRVIAMVVAGLVLWFGVSVAWAVQGTTDTVPVGIDYNDPAKPPVSQDVACNGVLDGNARDDTPLPVLAAQPAGSPALAYQRTPCELVHRNGRIVLGLDIAFMAAAVVALVAFVRYRRRHDDLAAPVLTAA